MDEGLAAPSLVKIASDPTVPMPTRTIALQLLLQQATADSRAALRTMDISGFSGGIRRDVQNSLSSPQKFTPRSQPKTTRMEFVTAFQAILKGDFAPFDALV